MESLEHLASSELGQREGMIAIIYRPIAAIRSTAMTMLVGAFYSDYSGDLLLAADGATSVRSSETGEWRIESTDTVKSLRLSNEVAFSLSGTLRQINCFLAHVFREPSWAKLGNQSPAVNIVLEDEAAHMVPGAELDDLEEQMQAFRLPFPQKNEGKSLVVMVGGVSRDGRSRLHAWRFFYGRTEIQHEFVPAIFSLHDLASEHDITQELTRSADTETCVASAIRIASKEFPNLIGGQATFRRLSNEFALERLQGPAQ